MTEHIFAILQHLDERLQTLIAFITDALMWQLS